MNHEAFGVFSNVDTSVRQRVQLAEITTSADVVEYHAERFSTFSVCDNGWAEKFQAYVVENPADGDPDYFHIVGEALNQASQFGHRMMEGHMLVAEDHRWTRSVFDRMHQVALMTHMARLNVQANSIKEELSNGYVERSWKAAIGIWGVGFHNGEGKILDPSRERMWDPYFYDTARLRFENGRRISLPRHEVNADLAQIVFSGIDAERMGRNEFADSVMPQVEKAIGLKSEAIVFENVQPQEPYIIRSRQVAAD